MKPSFLTVVIRPLPPPCRVRDDNYQRIHPLMTEPIYHEAAALGAHQVLERLTLPEGCWLKVPDNAVHASRNSDSAELEALVRELALSVDAKAVSHNYAPYCELQGCQPEPQS